MKSVWLGVRDAPTAVRLSLNNAIIGAVQHRVRQKPQVASGSCVIPLKPSEMRPFRGLIRGEIPVGNRQVPFHVSMSHSVSTHCAMRWDFFHSYLFSSSLCCHFIHHCTFPHEKLRKATAKYSYIESGHLKCLHLRERCGPHPGLPGAPICLPLTQPAAVF